MYDIVTCMLLDKRFVLAIGFIESIKLIITNNHNIPTNLLTLQITIAALTPLSPLRYH
jgi:hypothetical protein